MFRIELQGLDVPVERIVVEEAVVVAVGPIFGVDSQLSVAVVVPVAIRASAVVGEDMPGVGEVQRC